MFRVIDHFFVNSCCNGSTCYSVVYQVFKGSSDTSAESNDNDVISISKDDGHLVDLTLEYLLW